MNKKFLSLVIFSVVAFIFLQIPINKLAGAEVNFTAFDLFAPISGALVGMGFGVVAVLAAQTINLLTGGMDSINTGSILRLFPTLFAIAYFALPKDRLKIWNHSFKSRSLLILPIVSIILFNLHPNGREAWFYSLFWLIPIVCYPLRLRYLVLRSLGATFTAHAVGGAIWIWVFNLPTSVWVSLIPIVALERSIFALGISAMYVLGNNLLAILDKQNILSGNFSYNKKYVFKVLK